MEKQFKIEIRKELEALFNKYKDLKEDKNKIIARSFEFCDTQKGKVLFVGINPSYKEGGKPDKEGGKPKQPYTLNPKEIDDKYYINYKKLADKANLKDEDWTYTDALYILETKQENINVFYKKGSPKDFLCEQLRITMKILEHCKPKLIVVCNKLASDFFGKHKKKNKKEEFTNVWMGYEFPPDSETLEVTKIIGIHPNSINGNKSTSLIGTPIIFSKYSQYMSNKEKADLASNIELTMKNLS